MRFSFHAGITVAGLPLYPVRFLSRRLFSADSSLALNLAAGSPPGDVLRARNQLPRLSPRGRAASGVSGSPTCDRVRGCPCATYRWGIKRMARQLSTRELMASFFFFRRKFWEERAFYHPFCRANLNGRNRILSLFLQIVFDIFLLFNKIFVSYIYDNLSFSESFHRIVRC